MKILSRQLIEPLLGGILLAVGGLGSLLGASQAPCRNNYWQGVEAEKVEFLDIEKALKRNCLYPDQFAQVRQACLAWRKNGEGRKAADAYRYLWSHESPTAVFSGDALALASIYNDLIFYEGALDIYKRQLEFDQRLVPLNSFLLARDLNNLGLCYCMLAGSSGDSIKRKVYSENAISSFKAAKETSQKDSSAQAAKLLPVIEANMASALLKSCS
jgi:tetratricopeptide (TPR) repeat protein